MDIEKLIRRLRNDSDAYRNGKTLGRAFADQEDVLDNAATALSTLQTENNGLKEKLYDGEGVNLVDYWMQQAKIEENGHRNCQAENEKLRERLAAGEWIDPAVELPPNDDMVLAIVSGKPADNITLEDAYELASYGSEGWIVEQYELWETPTVTWWRPLPDPPEKKKEER